MTTIRTPPSLKWLLNKRARLLGDIQRLENTLPERTAKSREKVVQAELQLCKAKKMLSYEEKILAQGVLTLRKDIDAIDTALSMHHIQIDPEIIPSIRSQNSIRATAYGEMTRCIFECLKQCAGRSLPTTEVALFVAIRHPASTVVCQLLCR